MKTTNLFKFKAIVFALLIGTMSLIQSCSSSDNPPVVINKVELQTQITASTAQLVAAIEGNALNQYLLGSKATYQNAVTLATAAAASTTLTQAEINAALIALNAAKALFATQIVTPIDQANLVGQWTFDEGTGTVAKDYSGNSYNGTFGSAMAGLGGPTAGVLGTALPTWTTDRYGNANKAIAFDKGAKITVPYNAALNPQKLSISVWLNVAEKKNNRFMGLHSWNGFKLEVQDGNLPFFTGNAGTTIYDRDDAGTALVLNTWYHLVIAFGDGNTVFYINGVAVKTWNNTPGNLAVAVGHDLVFGVDSSKYAAVTTNYDTDKIIPAEWGGFFHGSLDEIRIYKSVLTQAQVTSIYNLEKKPL